MRDTCRRKKNEGWKERSGNTIEVNSVLER
jgi:hypothetical protein